MDFRGRAERELPEQSTDSLFCMPGTLERHRALKSYWRRLKNCRIIRTFILLFLAEDPDMKVPVVKPEVWIMFLFIR